ncbi:MAG: pyridoxal-phosphate dependent enzyme [Candidatus Latescibacteria bacterium]|jgi:threonine synthase|nr:pyridoxal-phosphate dependent enzyme [Candidatus Latescibacterota bacterium]
MKDTGLICTVCGAEYPMGPMFHGCPSCQETGTVGALTVTYDYDAIRRGFDLETWSPNWHSIWRFRDLLPVQDSACQITLGESDTGLIRPRRLQETTGLSHLYIKNETTNPTWAFKDRFHAVSISMAKELGYTRVTASTTGNHGASAAAYSAAAGMDSCVILCHPESSELQRNMIRLYGGHAYVLNDRFQYLDRLITEYGFYPSTTMEPMPMGTPFGIEGYKTIAFEIYLQLARNLPDHMFCPIAAGDSLYGPWKGFGELKKLGLTDTLPVMHGVQPAGCNPYVRSFQENSPVVMVHPDPQSIALSIRDDVGGRPALQAMYDSEGDATDVTDDEIVEAVKLLAHSGILVEPSSAASVAGAIKAAAEGRIKSDETVVCLVTGSGAKWPEVMADLVDEPASIEPSWETIRTEVGL